MSQADREVYTRFMESGALSRLPKHLLWKLMKQVTEERKARYPRNHARVKYGKMNKGFAPEEFDRFMKFCENPKARLCLRAMHALGLRIGEAVVMKLEHLDFLQRSLLVHTEKSGTHDLLPLHDGIYYELQSWVNERYEQIMRHGGYVFYSDNPSLPRQHISKDWLRNYFGQVREQAGLTQVYAMTRERSGRQPHRQFRLTTHSNRHSFGTYLWHATKDRKIVQEALRHRDGKSTDVYIHVSQEEVDAAICQAFRQSPPHVLLHHK